MHAHFALHEHTTGLASYSRQKHRIAKSAQSIDLMPCSRKKQPRFLRSGQPWEAVAAPLRLLRTQHCFYWQLDLLGSAAFMFGLPVVWSAVAMFGGPVHGNGNSGGDDKSGLWP